MQSRFLAALLIVTSSIAGGCQSARPIDTVRESGDFMMRQGNYAGAADEFGEIIAKYPGNWEDQYKYGLCMLELKKYADARRAMEVAYNATNSVIAAKHN
jgi:tetratricopeptide (TPR) repeat protein